MLLQSCRMKARERYFVLAVFLLALLCWLCLLWVPRRDAAQRRRLNQRNKALIPNGRGGRSGGSSNFVNVFEWNRGSAAHFKPLAQASLHGQCSMSKCFDFARCHGRPFKVYVYPDAPAATGARKKKSVVFGKILDAIRSSRFYTSDPQEACIFVPSMDTTDRDELSKDFDSAVAGGLSRLPHWNGGRNHLLFNLFSGTWPRYKETLGFDTGKAILAKASMHRNNFRTGFDISLPLFTKEHPMRGGLATAFERRGSLYPIHRQYLVTFKGKRYLSGIGSEVRSAVHHLHNDKDVIMLTTCKHGKFWANLADKRCAADNELYDKFDYHDLLENSTFCLVPRGRRLGSFRFLESMFAACVPVSMSNGYVLPFDEVIDWNRAVVNVDERRLLELPSIMRFVSTESVVQYRQQVQFLSDTYFSSIDKIIMTTLEILQDRVNPHSRRTYEMWNHAPGGLVALPSFSQQLHHFPFYTSMLRVAANETYTAVITARTPLKNSASPLIRLIKQLAMTSTLRKIVVVWCGSVPPPKTRRWPKITQPIEVIVAHDGLKNGMVRFIDDRLIASEAVLSLEEDSKMNVDEINFGFRVWKDFPDRIVGYLARSHYWSAGNWSYEPRLGNEYSMILLNGAFYHKYYNHVFHKFLQPQVLDIVRQTAACADIAFNFLVSYITKHPPVKVGQKHGMRIPQPMIARSSRTAGNSSYYDDPSIPESAQSLVYIQRERCLRSFTATFGEMPLTYSQMRFDPLLYRDNVSNSRKRYHKVGQ